MWPKADPIRRCRCLLGPVVGLVNSLRAMRGWLLSHAANSMIGLQRQRLCARLGDSTGGDSHILLQTTPVLVPPWCFSPRRTEACKFPGGGAASGSIAVRRGVLGGPQLGEWASGKLSASRKSCRPAHRLITYTGAFVAEVCVGHRAVPGQWEPAHFWDSCTGASKGARVVASLPVTFPPQ